MNVRFNKFLEIPILAENVDLADFHIAVIRHQFHDGGEWRFWPIKRQSPLSAWVSPVD
ncbi:MAG: hypothetical protein WCA45_16975 [Thiobacillaceae bacterium]